MRGRFLHKGRKEETIPECLKDEEVERILATPTLEKYPLDKAVIYVLLNTGLRRQEVINLNCDDIDLVGNALVVRCGKGKKDRVIPLNESVKVALIDYLTVRPKCDIEAFFIGMRTARKRIGKKYLQSLLQRVLREAGIKRKITLHKLRHTFATSLVERGADIESVRELLGHRDLSTTQTYLHASKNRLAKMVSLLDNSRQ